jgi:hypothetical protein
MRSNHAAHAPGHMRPLKTRLPRLSHANAIMRHLTKRTRTMQLRTLQQWKTRREMRPQAIVFSPGRKHVWRRFKTAISLNPGRFKLGQPWNPGTF